jgi:multicomponent K+:H+ antiporter subunit F
MIAIALDITLGCFAFAILLNLVHLFRAPTVVDRILALDTMVVNGIAIMVLYGASVASTLNFEVAILLAMTGFLSTVAFCKFLLRGSIIE